MFNVNIIHSTLSLLPVKSLYDRRLLCAAYFALAGQSVSFDDLWLITSAPTIDRPGRKANRLPNLQFNKPASCSSGVELMVVVHIWKELSSKEKSLTRRTHFQLNLFHGESFTWWDRCLLQGQPTAKLSQALGSSSLERNLAKSARSSSKRFIRRWST